MTSVKEWQPLHVRAGHRFQSIAERELDTDLRSLAARLPHGDDDILLIPEFAGANGIADLVSLTRSREALHSRISSGIPFLTNLMDASIVASVPIGRTAAVSSTAVKLGMSERQLSGRVRRLVSNGSLLKFGHGFRRDPNIIPIGRMYAFEAKVTDWRRAMSQAVRYGTWSDAVGVVLLNRPRDISAAADRARTFKIGLAVGKTWIVRPRIRPNDVGLRLFASERFCETTALSSPLSTIAIGDYGVHRPSADA